MTASKLLWKFRSPDGDPGAADNLNDFLKKHATQFYLKFGFEPPLDNRLHVFLPMSTIRKLEL